MKKQIIFLLILGFVLIIGCAKELSFETGNTPSVGSLQSDITGDCLPKTVNGTYIVGTPLVAANNTITVQVSVSQTGAYLVNTDTVNGYYFRASGIFTTLGINTVTLRSSGTPFATGIDNFVVSYDSTICDIQVSVLPAGAGGPAVFTLAGAPTNCTGASVHGTYVKDGALNSTNSVDINVNVTTIGTYSVSATFQGMTFSGTGTFLATGANTVHLIGSGTPTTVGLNTVPLTVAATTCSFPVTVNGPAVFTIDCSGATVNGTYQTNTALTSSNTVNLPVNVTTGGAYSITTTAVNGMVFSGSGTLTAGAGTITLTGSGTPTNATTSSISVSFGTSSCSFNVTVTAGASVDWQFKVGSTVYQGSTVDAIQTTASGITVLAVQGPQDDGIGSFAVTMDNTTGGISTGVYSGTAITGKFATFVYGNGTITWTAGPGFPGANLPVNLTVYNTTTHIVQGTFAGTVSDGAGGSVTITNGTFKANFP